MSKNKIKEIEQKYDMWADSYNLDPQDVEWLIEQVKRVQGLEKCLGELIKQNKEMRKSAGFYNSETYNAHLERLLDSREKQIQDLRIDVSFYKMASERYEYVEQQNNRYREAILLAYYELGFALDETEIDKTKERILQAKLILRNANVLDEIK